MYVMMKLNINVLKNPMHLVLTIHVIREIISSVLLLKRLTDVLIIFN